MIKKKIFIFSFISSIIAFVFCLFNINSYAYQTNSNFTNTIDSIIIESNNSQLNLESQTFYGSNRYRIFLNDGIYKGQYLCINFYIDNSVYANSINFTYTQNNVSSQNTFNYSLYKGLNNSYSVLISLNANYVYSNIQDSLYDYLRFGFNANLSIRIDNIDIIDSIDVYTSFYFEIYQNQLNELQSLYDDLEDDYSTLQGQYDTLENDYETLQNSYNNIQNDYNGITLNTNPFIFNNVDSYSITLNSQDITSTNNNNSNIPTYYFTFNNNSISLDAYSMYLDSDVEIYWDSSSTNLIIIDINLDDYSTYSNFSTNEFHFSEFYNESLIIKYYRDNILVNSISITDSSTIDDNITNFSIDVNRPYNKIVLEFELRPTIDQNTKYIIYNVQSYNLGYSNGYKDGYNIGYVNGEEYANETMQNTIGVNAYNDGYADGYAVYTNYLDNGTSYETILISLATGPINIFKQIFNFEVLGANLSVLITSVITLLITIWVIKRFLK